MPPAPRDAKRAFAAAVRAVIAARRFTLDPRAKRSYELDAGVTAATIGMIDLDLPRTARREPLVRAHMGRIRAMLLRQAAEDPRLGYCQGMSFAAAVFAAAAARRRGGGIGAGSQGGIGQWGGGEARAGGGEEAYRRFHALVQLLRGLWLPGLPLVHDAMARFELLTRGRPWRRHLRACEVEPSMFLPQALMTLLALWLPVSTIVPCLGKIERHGLDGMLAMVAAVLDHNGGRLLRVGTMEGLLRVLGNLHEHSPQPSALKVACREVLRKSRVVLHAELCRSRRDVKALVARPGHGDVAEGVGGSGHPACWARPGHGDVAEGVDGSGRSACWLGSALWNLDFLKACQVVG